MKSLTQYRVNKIETDITKIPTDVHVIAAAEYQTSDLHRIYFHVSRIMSRCRFYFTQTLTKNKR